MKLFGWDLDRIFSVFLLGFFLVNLACFQNHNVELVWKVLVWVLAFTGVFLLVFASDFLNESFAENNKKNWRYKT